MRRIGALRALRKHFAERRAVCRAVRIDPASPAGNVLGRNQPCDGNACESGVPEKERAVLECATQCFDDDMVAAWVSEPVEEAPLEHAERLRERDPAGGRE